MSLPLSQIEIADFKAGTLLIEGEVFDRLYEYFTNPSSPEPMPYGVAKARTGDPYVWIEDTLGGLLR